MTATALAQLAATQAALRALIAPLPATLLSRQPHPDLSPLGWHIGHCVVIEIFWIREQLLGQAGAAAPWKRLYFPDLSVKQARGAALPGKNELLDWAVRAQAENLALLSERGSGEHFLLEDAYLPRFLTRHHAQHLETMRMGLAQFALQQHRQALPELEPHVSEPSTQSTVELAEGSYAVGQDRRIFDNEGPAREVRLLGCRLGLRPVSNAEYLGFMEADGYRRPELWSPAGQTWLAASGARAPAFWRKADRHWYQVTPEGPQPLCAAEPVCGLSGFEAEAFARWAGGRLPHEYEWEAAARQGLMEQVGHVWEWCSNRFHPYPGFRAFPYERYSLPWFDGAHYALRGGSRYTEPCIRYPSFRNFYTRDKRHVFAGCRLAYDT